MRIEDEERVIAAEDAARYRDALGCAIPVGLPVAFTDPVARPLEHLVGRYARTHGPFLVEAVARRFAVPDERVAGALAALGGRGPRRAGRVPPGRRGAGVVRRGGAAAAPAPLARRAAS